MNLNEKVHREGGFVFCGMNHVRDYPFGYKHWCAPDGDFVACPELDGKWAARVGRTLWLQPGQEGADLHYVGLRMLPEKWQINSEVKTWPQLIFGVPASPQCCGSLGFKSKN